jgi:transposase
MKPTYEELEKIVKEQAETIVKLQGFLKLALERISELEERFNKNSKNSSKPPSGDKKPNSKDPSSKGRALRRGYNRQVFPIEKIDAIVNCQLDLCPDCGSNKLLNEDNPEVLQQVELPEIKALVTEFRCQKYKCQCCGSHSIAHLPNGIPNSSFGPKLMALVAHLTGVLHLAKREAIQLLKDLYDIDICEGSIINVEERVANAIKDIYERIHQFVTKSPFCKHFDETSWRNAGKNHYVWVASTQHATCFKIDPSRSRYAFENFVGRLGTAPVVTDRYAVYNKVSRVHQYCLAHLIRDFRKFAERKNLDGEIGSEIEELFRKVCRVHSRYKREEISIRSRNIQISHLRKKLEGSLIDGMASGSADFGDFCQKILDKFENLLMFTKSGDIDPTNNLAERDLRSLVLWRKKSYGTRSERGKRFAERISSVAGTIKRKGLNTINFLKEAVCAFYRSEEAPYLCITSGF